MVRRVVAQRWSSAGGRGRRRERVHLLELGRAPRPRRGGGSVGSLVGAAAGPAPDQRGSPGGDRGPQAAADDRRRDPDGVGDAAVDRLGSAGADRAGQALAAGGARACEPRRALTAGRAGPRRCQKARGDRRCWAPHHRPAPAPARQPTRRRCGAPTGWEFVHVCVDDATRSAYVEVLADEDGATAASFCGVALRSTATASPSSA